jgi:hypothetical protein
MFTCAELYLIYMLVLTTVILLTGEHHNMNAVDIMGINQKLHMNICEFITR